MQVVRLLFLAPVPRGHDVVVTWFKQHGDSPDECLVVVDLTAGVLYCDENTWGPLGTTELALRDPVTVLTRWSWVLTRSLSGVSGGALVSTKDRGEGNHVRTDLFVEPGPPAPYR
ncbi:MAG: hypothetical protein JST00_35550 [Deltaproteobacteria bacterium]|nr:hypothetical protein [Deltaproteobacteria bacterium]